MVLSKALDLYSRIGMGQYSEIMDIEFSPLGADGKPMQCSTWSDKLGRMLDEISRTRLGFLGTGTYHGINSNYISDRFRVAWDLHQIVRHQLWKDRGEKPTHCVDSSIFLTSCKERPAEISKV